MSCPIWMIVLSVIWIQRREGALFRLVSWFQHREMVLYHREFILSEIFVESVR